MTPEARNTVAYIQQLEQQLADACEEVRESSLIPLADDDEAAALTCGTLREAARFLARYRDTLVSPKTNTGVGELCAPGPADQQRRVWILRYEDNDRGDFIFDNETIARQAFARAEGLGWNCHLFEHARRAPPESFQARVQPWLIECFGAQIAGDREERNHRFLEESLELVQALGCTASEAHQLVDYVFGRPSGEPTQEAGGVMVTLAALCLTNSLDMHEAGETELARVWTKVEVIRAKQAAKPKHSPLPAAAARFKLTSSEISELLEMPEALRLLARWRDFEQGIADNMGVECVGDQARAAELRAESDRIERDL